MDRWTCDGCGAEVGDVQPVGRCLKCNSDFSRLYGGRPERNKTKPDLAYGLDSQTELPAGRFEISVQPMKAHMLERFVASETMLEHFELLTVEVGDDAIHHNLTSKRDGHRHIYLVRPVEVAAGATVKLHAVANSAGHRFTVTAVGLAPSCEHESWTADCESCDLRDGQQLAPGCLGCNGEGWRARGERLGFGYADYIELPKLDGEPVCTECGQRWGPDPKQVRSGSVQCAYGIDSGSEITSGAVESPQVFRSLSVQRFISKQEVAEAIETMDFEVSSNVDVRHPCKLQPYEEHECYPVNEAGERLDVPELGPAREWTLQKPVEVRAGDTTTLHVTLRHAMRITVTAVGPPC